MQHSLLIPCLSSYLFFKITLSLSPYLSCLSHSLPLFLQTGDQCSAHLIIPEAPWALVSPVLKEELEQHTLLHTRIHTDALKSINARLALVLADLIFWANRAMQTWLSVRSHDNEQSLISPQRRPPFFKPPVSLYCTLSGFTKSLIYVFRPSSKLRNSKWNKVGQTKDFQ